jgi:hypothetical protein
MGAQVKHRRGGRLILFHPFLPTYMYVLGRKEGRKSSAFRPSVLPSFLPSVFRSFYTSSSSFSHVQSPRRPPPTTSEFNGVWLGLGTNFNCSAPYEVRLNIDGCNVNGEDCGEAACPSLVGGLTYVAPILAANR